MAHLLIQAALLSCLLVQSFSWFSAPIVPSVSSRFHRTSSSVWSTPEDDYVPLAFELDPSSKEAESIVVDQLNLSHDQYQQLVDLSHAVTDWNERVNLVSRKDCSPATVFGRHILPSLAVCAQDNALASATACVDVGTGGGFPGLPLAIAYPDVDFVLLDSVGKKLTAVSDMAKQVGLTNVEIHHGRAEDLRSLQFGVATGRSVSALPQFCAWMQHLLEDDGELLYWIGGEIEASILSRTASDTPIDELVPEMESDKRILVFPASEVKAIAKESGIVVKPTKPANSRRQKASAQRAKGQWRKKERTEPKQRGYDDFQRYSSQ